MKNFFNAINKMLPLFVIQFFTWIALFTLWIYATPVITRYFFHTTDSETAAFAQGTHWVAICFALYSLLSTILGFLIPTATKKFGVMTIHAFALSAGSIGLGSMYFFTTPYALLGSFIFIGIAWSSIGTIPYLIVGKIAPENKSSFYFSVFNFSVVLPQVTSALLLAWITNHWFAGNTRLTILLGGGCMLVAAILTYFHARAEKLTI